MKRNRAVFLMGMMSLSMLLSMAGCSTWNPYRPEIHQGNKVTPEAIGRLTVGMTTAQVQAILGTPISRDVFQKQRWDYLNYSSRTGDKLTVQRLTLWFEGDHLNRWEAEGLPATVPSESPASNPVEPSKEP